jgi:hypothetical protein
MMRVDAVRRIYKPMLGRPAAVQLMKLLGGKRRPGVGWEVPTARVLKYLRDLEKEPRGDTWQNGAKDSTAYPSTSAKDTGSLTSGSQTAPDASVPFTSEPTAAESRSEPPRPLTGKSKHELQLAKMLDEERQRRRSVKRSKRSEQNRNSQSSDPTRSARPGSSDGI